MITSRENEKVKLLNSLKMKKARDKSGLCIVEGEKLVRECVNKGFAAGVFASEDYRGEIEPNEVLSNKLFDEITEFKTPKGVLAVAKIPNSGVITFPYLVLDNIQEPANVGAIIRSAVAFGFKSVISINSADAFSAKAIRASAGLSLFINIIEKTYNEFIAEFKSGAFGEKLILADLNGEEFALNDPNFGLILGNEGQGISPELKTLPHKTFTIKMNDFAESLNVAVAAGIIMKALNEFDNR
ncbi:MAG: RNA methyltransferase [Christensenellaceae bacterium]|jgi:TrmH family RNA methyltransferase|nr:RNA methyltransferase [Christensenellaceae bacterium]